MNQRLLIVDGHSYAYRGFYAIRQLNSPTGQPTNAIYGFIRMLGKIQAFLQPTHCMVVWDGGLCEKRMAVLPEYKTHRPPMPPLLEAQIEEIGKFLHASNIASYCREGVEADDWIATLARIAVEKQYSVIIASADKDFMQLVSPQIGLLNPNDKEPKVWNAADVRAKTGVDPAQIIDWLALVGDSVDNVPGVEGIGPTTATKLVQQFGSIDDLYRRLDEVGSERIRGKLASAAEMVKRNQQVIRLNEHLPDVVCCEDLEVKPPDCEALKVLYQQWGFRTLLEELAGKPGGEQRQLL